MFVALFLAFAEPPKITIGKETTYITEPLRADGIVDYLGAANAKLATIDPKDNAAVLLVQAFGPEVLPKNGSQEYFRLLRCAKPPTGEVCFDDIEQLMERKLGRKLKQGDVVPLDEYGVCSRAPWKAAEHPLYAELLKVNEKPLQLVVEASRRPILATPFPSGGDPPIMAPTEDPFSDHSRMVARLLKMRCMLRAGEGDLEGAFADIDVCYRLAMLLGGSAPDPRRAIAVAIRGSAFAAEEQMLKAGNFSLTVLRERARLIAAQPPTIDAGKCITHWDRMWVLNSIINAQVDFRRRPDADKKQFQFFPIAPLGTSAELERGLRTVNQFYDGLAECFNHPNRSERCCRLMQYEADLAAKAGKTVKSKEEKAHEALKFMAEFPHPPKTFQEGIDWICEMSFTSVNSVEEMSAGDLARQRVTVLALLLAARKLESGKYPERLDAKELGVASEMTVDPFTEKPFHYRVENGKSRLHSPGPDRISNTLGEPIFDDIIVELP
jgi:hypothetical protein